MRNSWIRAWIAAVGLLIAAAVVVRNRTSMLLKVEEPVMEWLLDGTDTSIWDGAAIFSRTWLLLLGTVILAVVGFFLDRRVGIAVVITSVFARILTSLVGGVVGRVAPTEGIEAGSFPSSEVVNAGVFWGLVVMMLWWVGAPRLVWQIVLEVAIVITLVVSIRLIVSGEVWPTDALGSTIVIALSLITAAVVLEANPPQLPERSTSEAVAAA